VEGNVAQEAVGAILGEALQSRAFLPEAARRKEFTCGQQSSSRSVVASAFRIGKLNAGLIAKRADYQAAHAKKEQRT